MYKLTILAALICASYAASVSSNEPVPILSEENVIEPDGAFHYSFESGDGTKIHEEGSIKPGQKPEEAIESVQGGYEFSSPEGQKVLIQYVADENGYQPSGDLLPVAPPIPEGIVKALRYLEEHPPPKELL